MLHGGLPHNLHNYFVSQTWKLPESIFFRFAFYALQSSCHRLWDFLFFKLVYVVFCFGFTSVLNAEIEHFLWEIILI